MRKFVMFATLITFALIGKVSKAFSYDSVSDLGGVLYSTVSFSSSRVQVANGDVLFEGVMVDSVASVPAYLTVTDTATALTCASCGYEAFKITLSSDSSGVSNSKGFVSDAGGGLYNLVWKPIAPIRMRYGLAVTLSDATIKKAIILYRRLK